MRAAVEVHRSRWRTSIVVDRTSDDVANRIRVGVMRQVVRDVETSDIGSSFVLLRGAVNYGRGIRLRTMVRVRGEVRPLPEGSEVSLRYRPHWEAVAWMMFTGLMAIAGLTALISTLVSGTGPVLWPIGAVLMFGGFTGWKVRQLQIARNEVEADLVSWVTT